MKLRPKAFWKLTPAEFELMARGHRQQQLASWQQTRWLDWVLANIHRDPDSPAIEPHELLPLPGDAQVLASGIMAPEDFDELMAQLSEEILP